MSENIDKLAMFLNLTKYQSNRLKVHCDRYNFDCLEKRGGVLCAPYKSRGVLRWITAGLFGVKADLIGQNRILLRAQRGIKFCANGYHCVRIGKYTYYANNSGDVISRDEFLRNTGLKNI